MADLGHQLTEKELKKLEKRIRDEYYIAQRDTRKKLQDYLQKTEAQRKIEYQKWMNKEITKKEYTDWCYRHQMMGKRWEEMLDVLASDYHHANEIALDIAKGSMPDIYALNANYATYQIEHDGLIDTGFTLYNHDTAAYLLGDQRQLMPAPSTAKAKQIAANKDMQWNKQHIQSAVLQGVLQGESPYQVAERLQQVGQMNYNSAVRYARTMTTSAQNAGRYEAFHRAKNLGVDLTIEWQATLDHRTRHAHRQMHGQRTEVDEPFHTPDGYTIYYPADCTGQSNAPQHEIWNCRCTLLGWVKGFEGDTVKNSPALGDMSFEEWQNEKASFTEPSNSVINNPSPFTPEAYSAERKANALKFDDKYKADDEYRKWLDDNWDNLTDEEKYSLWQYTHNSNPINKSLSGYHDDWDRSSFLGVANTDWGHEDSWRRLYDDEFIRKFGKNGTDHVSFYDVIQDLTNGIDKYALEKDAYFVRGGGSGGLAGLFENGGVDFNWAKRVIDNGTREEREKLRQLVIDQTFQEHGFLSTGIAKGTGFSGRVTYSIYAPQGTHAIYAEPASYYGETISGETLYKTGMSFYDVGNEAEMLFQRGSTYRITDLEFHGSHCWVKMEVVDQPDYFLTGAEDTFNNGSTKHKRWS